MLLTTHHFPEFHNEKEKKKMLLPNDKKCSCYPNSPAKTEKGEEIIIQYGSQ